MDLCSLTASAISRLLLNREITSEELCEAYLRRIELVDERISAFTCVFAERAMKEARQSDERRVKGEDMSSLDGIPIAIKDNIRVWGEAEESELKDFDSDIVTRCKEEGLIVLGKTTIGWPAGARNPYNPTRVAGLDSEGTAACLAAGETPLSLGTDIGGTLRVSSAYCGVLGLRPTKGAISGRGILTRSSTMDLPGSAARCVSDIKMMLDILREPVAGERMEEVAQWQEGTLDARGLRLGVSVDINGPDTDSDVNAEISHAMHCMKDVGVEMVDLDIQLPPETSGIHDALTNLEEFEDTYKAAHMDAEKVEWEFTKAFRQCDIILMPVSAQVAPHAGMGMPPEQPWLRDNHTLAGVDLAGLPALAIPCGFAHAMPVGIQLIAPCWHENLLLRLAYAYECLAGPPGLARMVGVDTMGGFSL